MALTLAACGDDDGASSPDDDAGIDVGPSDSSPGDATSDAVPPPPPDAGPDDPGALVGLTLQSVVGVVLDDLPESIRDRAAEVVLAEPRDVWIARARAQISSTRLRLTYRRYFALLDSGEFKAQLPLPPAEQWEIELDEGAPVRETIDGHDVVGLGYTMRGWLLTDAESVETSEPALSTVGGTWDEPFVFPVEPDLLLARTGLACMRETDLYSNIDSENALQYYDHSCLETADGVLNCHMQTRMWPESCNEALEANVGRVETVLRFERLPWDESLASRVRISATTEGAPDLQVLTEGLPDQPAGLQNHRVVYRYVEPGDCTLLEQCVGGPGWRRLLLFDASLKNVGDADLHLGEVEGSALAMHNVYEYSACHMHHHFRFYGDFEVAADGESFTGDKRAFCLLSTTRYANDERTALSHRYDGCGYQGIAAGWGDDYYAGLDCQWIDITDLDTTAGAREVELRFDANPDDFLCEGAPRTDASGELVFEPTDMVGESGQPIDRPMCDFTPGYDDDNEGTLAVSVPRLGSFVTGPCRRGQLGPGRDCGFDETPAAEIACTPGEPVSVRCSLGSSGAPQVVRLCEGSAVWGRGLPCEIRQSAGEGVAVDGAPLDLEATCPDRRSADEPGGTIHVYRGPVFPGDPLSPLSCTEA